MNKRIIRLLWSKNRDFQVDQAKQFVSFLIFDFSLDIFGQRRKRDKSLDQKPSTSNNKSSKISKFSRSITKTNETNATTPDLNDFTTITDNPDSFVSRQSNRNFKQFSEISIDRLSSRYTCSFEFIDVE